PFIRVSPRAIASRFAEKSDCQRTELMTISAIIATYNRRESVAACLASLFEQDLPSDQYEIVVVVDGSSDGTGEMLRPCQPRGALVVIEQENKGQTAALNAGASAARGDIVLFLDDDLICDRQLLSRHIGGHKDGEPTVAFGRMGYSFTEHRSAVEKVFC